MPTKRKASSSSHRLRNVYLVLLRQSAYGDYNRGDDEQHNVSCVSIHTTLAAANAAAKDWFEIDDNDESVDREYSDSWESWEDLAGIRVQTDAGGMVRVISAWDTLEEQLVWVEKNSIQYDSEAENDSEVDEEGHSRGDTQGSRGKKLKTG